MCTSKKYFLFSICFVFLSSSTIQTMSVQELLNNEELRTSAASSSYNLGLPITPELIKQQLNSFNERMKQKGISAVFATNHQNDVRIRFFANLPYSNEKIPLYTVDMPFSEKINEVKINEATTRAQLKRRFENRIEDLLERQKDEIDRKALEKYKKSWRKKLYFKVIPSITDNLANVLTSDIAKIIIKHVPSFKKSSNTLPVELNDLKNFLNEFSENKKKLDNTQQLALEVEKLEQLIETLPKEQKASLKKELYEEFCTLFEKQLID